MSTKAELIALAERVEALAGPCRETDAQITAITRCGSDPEWTWALTNYPHWVAGRGGRVYLTKGGPSFVSPAYTASLDAALTLAPPDHFHGFITDGDGVGFKAYCQQCGKLEPVLAATPALALTAAALRARALMIGDEA